MTTRKKPAPLVWEPMGERVTHEQIAANYQCAARGDRRIVVWNAGCEIRWRSRFCDSGRRPGRIVSHFGEDDAKASSEKRLRKAGV